MHAENSTALVTFDSAGLNAVFLSLYFADPGNHVSNSGFVEHQPFCDTPIKREKGKEKEKEKNKERFRKK